MGKRKTTKDFINEAMTVHGERYDYSLVEYINSKSKVCIICPDHGEFWQTPTGHLSGKGCEKCGIKKRSDIIRTSVDDFVYKSNKRHDHKYDYSLVYFYTTLDKVTIICPLHGEFIQVANDHLRGNGCEKCGTIKQHKSIAMNTNEFINKAKLIHGDRYDYSLVDYVNNGTKVIIICPDHGEFTQRPHGHIQTSLANGCPKCRPFKSVSSQSWLDSLNIPDNEGRREVKHLVKGKRYIADGYDPLTKTVYEFHGDYWHGNPNVYDLSKTNPSTKTTFGELYEKTQIKKQDFLDAGYNYIEMWESDWKLLTKKV